MVGNGYTLTMARYNAWQNESLGTAADGLSVAERMRDRGAFFGSIQRTLSHLLWADRVWLSRLADTPAPTAGIADSPDLIEDWALYRTDRRDQDALILRWAKTASDDWFDGEITWFSGAAGRDVRASRSLCVIHFFNHQTHHRGQVHAMLTAAGARPEPTDLPFLPEGTGSA